ncbi:TldD/PmbA family protein [Amycolatopsis sp. NPDC005003]
MPTRTGRTVDPSFTELPLADLADAALDRARVLGATHASLRVDRTRTAQSLTHNGKPRADRDVTTTGLSVRVARAGAWGFAGTSALTPAAAAEAAEDAMTIANACLALGSDSGQPSEEPVHPGETWLSEFRLDPLAVPAAERFATLADWSAPLLDAAEVQQVLGKLVVTKEHKFYADLAGTVTTQQRVRVHPQLLVAGFGAGTFATLRTLGPPAARGWEYVGGEGWDWAGELARLPEQLAEKCRAEPVRPGHLDLVLDPSQLWLTIHESVGHATELDRALGHEAAYAGTTFAAPDDLGRLRFGSPLMQVVADRTTPHALATVGFDDEGVAAQSWPLVEDGVLTGFQLDRRTAAVLGARSNGCAYASTGTDLPLQRMPNVSLRPGTDDTDTASLISDVTDGVYLVGSDSFSIDSRRDNFQFSAQRAYRIHHGRLCGQLAGLAYQARTLEFWAALAGLGGPGTYGVFGADLCGKGQPVQAAATSHGCPSALFRGIRVLDTANR